MTLCEYRFNGTDHAAGFPFVDAGMRELAVGEPQMVSLRGPFSLLGKG
jgi:hypothetical protein